MTVDQHAPDLEPSEDDLFEEIFDPLNRSFVRHGLERINETIAMTDALAGEDERFMRAPLQMLKAAALMARLELEGKI